MRSPAGLEEEAVDEWMDKQMTNCRARFGSKARQKEMRDADLAG